MESNKLDIRRIEELSLNSWPSFTTLMYDGWIVRFAKGYTKRANSVIPLYHSTIDVGQKVSRCVALYRERGLPAIFKLTASSEPSTLDNVLADRDFARIDVTSVQTLPLDGRELEAGRGVVAQSTFDAAWLEGYFQCIGLDDVSKRTSAARLTSLINNPVVTVRKVVGGNIVGCGFGAIEAGAVGIFDIAVRPDFRRRGFATEIVSAILDQATVRGARLAYLQVMAANHPAVALYCKLGFTELYQYWYRTEARGS